MSLFKAFGRWMWDARVYVLGLIAVIAWICLYPVYAPKLISHEPSAARAEPVEALTEQSLAEIQQNAFEQTASWVWAFAGAVFAVIFAVAIATFITARSRVPYHYQPTPLRPVTKLEGGSAKDDAVPAKRDEPASEPRPARKERTKKRRARPPVAAVAHDDEDDPESFAARLQRNRENRT